MQAQKTQRTALITGCSEGGIGDALAREFHAKGIKVFATSRTLKPMQSLKEIGVETFVLDVADSNSIAAIKDAIVRQTGGTLDILVNNAGISYPYPVTDFSMDRVRETYNTNILGPMEMVHVFSPLLIKSGDGRVVNIGSVAGIAPVPFGAVYNSSKAALHAFGDTLRLELAPFGVKVLTVVTGNVSTNIMKSERLPLDSIYQPIDDIYQRERHENFQDRAIPAEEYARIVVNETLKVNPKAWLWAGNNSLLIWVLHTFGGRRAFDSPLSDRFGLTRLAELLRVQNQKGP